MQSQFNDIQAYLPEIVAKKYNITIRIIIINKQTK